MVAHRTVSRWLAGTAWSRIRKVEITGLKRTSSREVHQAARLPRDGNLMNLPLDSVAARINQLPSVKEARVFRRLPGRLVIDVEERCPLAAIAQGDLILVDEEGRTFKQGRAREVVDVPFLSGEVKPGSAGFKRALGLLLHLREDYPTVYQHLGEVSIIGKKLRVRLRDGGAEIRGADIMNPAVLSNLEMFLTQAGTELPVDMEYVDMRFPGMVITGTGEEPETKPN